MAMKALCLAGLVWGLTGCGYASMPKKMDDTNGGVTQLNHKMDSTNGQLGQTNTQLGQTNTQLGQTNTQLGQTNTQLGKTNTQLGQTNTQLGQTNGKLDQTNTQLGQTNGKLDQTNVDLGQMHGQLDQTNAKLDQTNGGLASVHSQLGQTNGGLSQVNSQLGQTNSGLATVAAKVDATNASLGQTNGDLQTMTTEMGTTNAAIHSQVLLLALQDLTSPANTTQLMPPIAMMPAGQKFAEEATAEEVMQLAHTWLAEYDAPFDDSSLASEGYSAADIAHMKADAAHTADAKFVGLEIIAAFLPQKTVQDIVAAIAAGDAYQSDGLAILTQRTFFISTILLQFDLLANKVTLYGQMMQVGEYLSDLDYLGRLPIAPQLSFTTQKTGPVKFDPKGTLVPLYQDVDQRFDTELVQPTDPQQKADLAQLRVKIKAALAYWQAH